MSEESMIREDDEGSSSHDPISMIILIIIAIIATFVALYVGRAKLPFGSTATPTPITTDTLNIDTPNMGAENGGGMGTQTPDSPGVGPTPSGVSEGGVTQG